MSSQRRAWIVLVALILMGSLVALRIRSQTRGASTPEERARAVRLARNLETNPLGKDAKEARQWLTLWLIEVPDITVKFCPDVLAPDLDSEKNDGNEIVTQMMYSQAAFIIENPKKAKDSLAVYIAGVEGALKAYEAIVKEKPEAKLALLDQVLAKRDKGQLADYVKQTAKKCK